MFFQRLNIKTRIRLCVYDLITVDIYACILLYIAI